ncbi:MAG: O-antigen ligase family protein [Chlamydiota bacterium]
MMDFSPFRDAVESRGELALRPLLALLMAAPLAFGAVLSWSWAAMNILIVMLALVWAVERVRRGWVTVVWSPLLLPALLLPLLAVAQMQAGQTLDAAGTREAALKLSACAVLFFLSLQCFSATGTGRWRRAGLAIAAYAFALALFAIIQFFASPGALYGLVQPRWGGYIFGPYVNHNSYAGLMEMLIALAAGLGFSLRRGHPARPFVLFAVLICLVSVLLSGSRGGVIALAAEFALFTAVMLAARPAGQARRRALMPVLILAVLAGASFFWLDPGRVWQRWQQLAEARELTADDRARMSADALRLARAHPAWGVGLGAFATAYPAYQTVVTEQMIDYAHNDYAQFLAEGGAGAGILLLISLPAFFCLAFRRLRRQLEEPGGWLRLGAAVGVCGLLLHSLVDFNLHIPANAAWFTLCAAWAVAPGQKGQG